MPLLKIMPWLFIAAGFLVLIALLADLIPNKRIGEFVEDICLRAAAILMGENLVLLIIHLFNI